MALPLAAMVIGSSLASAGANYLGAKKASGVQARGIEEGLQFQRNSLQRIISRLAPYMDLGERGVEELTGLLPYLTEPIGLDQEFLESTPGYQFARGQGQRGIDAAMAKAGLSGSGAAVKEAGRFSTGLADLTYGEQFQRARQNRGDIMNRLMQMIESGRGSVGQLSGAAVPASANIAQGLSDLGTARAAPYAVAGQAAGQVGQNALSAYMLQNYLKPGMTAGNTGMYGNQYDPSGWNAIVEYG